MGDGCAARGGGDRALPVGQAGGKGAHARCATLEHSPAVPSAHTGKSAPSEGNLAAQGEIPEALANLDHAGRAEPVHVDVAPLEDEAHIRVWVPAQRGARDRLLAAKHKC